MQIHEKKTNKQKKKVIVMRKDVKISLVVL